MGGAPADVKGTALVPWEQTWGEQEKPIRKIPTAGGIDSAYKFLGQRCKPEKKEKR